jgi:mannose/fructose/N-acetylgalactosamine-specific phosphotransferase system component IIC
LIHDNGVSAMVWFVTLALVAGVLAVDHRAGWQGLVAHPVFASVLVGSVLGEVSAALAVGLPIELVYLSIIPMRGGRSTDQVAAGVVGPGTAGLLMRQAGGADPAFICAVGVFLGLAAGEVGARITAPFFGLHNRFLGGVEFPQDLERRSLARRLSLIHFGSLVYIFVVEGLAVLLLAAAAYHLGEMFTRIADGALVRGSVWWSRLVLAIGAASIVHLFWQHRLRLVLAACAALVVIVSWLW